jgi:thioredoxin 1
MSENAKQFTDANFEQEVLRCDRPVLVEFWAPWCKICRRLGLTTEKLAGDYADHMKIGRYNTDECHATGARLKIEAIPTMLLFEYGKVTRKFVGLRKEAELKEILDEV